MSTYLIVLSLALAGQTGGAGDRYPPPRATGQPSATNAGASGATPIPLKSSTPASSPSGVKDALPADSPYNPSRPPNSGGLPALPANNGTSAPPSSGQSQPPPSNFQAQPIFPADLSTAPPSGSGPKPSAMMQAMLSPPQDSRLRGDPVQLVEAISSGRNRNEQTQRIEAYWDLCSSVADYYLGLREHEEFRKLATYVSNPGAGWQQAEKELGVRIDTSLRAARAAQFRLAGFIGRGANNLPLPADMPHCGSYTTQYEKIFNGRSSPEAQELAGLLSRRYAELTDAGAGVTRAEEWLDGSVRSGGSDGTGSIQALELLALRRRAFVQIARDYNRRIARYTELSTPGQIGAERLASMLIKRTSSTATRSSGPVPGPNWQSSNSKSAPPRTFVEDQSSAGASPINSAGKRDGAVQPTSGTQSESRGERSVLVQPR